MRLFSAPDNITKNEAKETVINFFNEIQEQYHFNLNLVSVRIIEDGDEQIVHFELQTPNMHFFITDGVANTIQTHCRKRIEKLSEIKNS